MKQRNGYCVLALIGMLFVQPVYALESLSDDELSNVDAQALLNLKYIDQGGTNPNASIGFYRLGLEGSIDLNANIRRLQLGCGGDKGAGCDIDIENLRFTGVGGTSATDSGPATDFNLTNPFIELAIKNPSIAATREFVGMRVGALSALGAMTFGENPNTSNLADDTGINTLSGDLNVTIINAVMTNVNVCVGFTLFGACVGIPLSGSATVDNYSQQLVVNRQATIADLGPMTAVASGSLLGLTLTNTHISGLPFRTVHRIDVRDPSGANTPTKDFYISVQKQDVIWQKLSTDSFAGATAAQKGWWLSIPQVVMENITSNDRVDVGAFAALGGAAFGTRVDIAPLDLGQRPADNCYGSLTFC
jgi:hypothetical protein